MHLHQYKDAADVFQEIMKTRYLFLLSSHRAAIPGS